MSKMVIAAIAALLPFTLVACDEDEITAPSEENIVATAGAAGSFGTLLAAVEAAGLVETLEGPGPWTVFAPTDEAFAQLPDGTVDELLLPENRDLLVSILTYHVVAEELPASEVVSRTSIETVQGQSLAVLLEAGVPFVNDSRIVQTDIAASNGIIHAIDTVLLPE